MSNEMDETDYHRKFYARMRHSFRMFMERAFVELNPRTQFKPNWHLDVICDELDKVRQGAGKLITIINVPPRSLKCNNSHLI